MRLILSLTALAVLTACSPASNDNSAAAPKVAVEQTAQTESERLNQWFEEKYEEQLQFSPLQMTYLGRKDKYDQLDDMSEEAEKKNLAWLAASVAELKSHFDYAKLDLDSKTSYDLWIYQYEQAQAGEKWRYHGYSFNQMFGPQSMLPNFMINMHRVDNLQDMQAYISRLNQMSRAAKQLIDGVHKSADIGVKAPYFAYDGVITQSKNVITGYPFDDSETDAPLMADAKRKIQALVDNGSIDQAKADELTEEAKAALLSSVKPAYLTFIDWFESDRANIPDAAQGASALPDGLAYYDYRLKTSTTTDLTADEIHQLGLSEVARLTAAMEKLKTEVGFEGTLQDFFAYIKQDVTDERFYYPDTDEGRQAYIDDTQAYLDYIDSKLPEYFGLLPKAKLVVKRVESFREQPGAAQHYSSGTPDGSRPGTYYVHLSDMTMMPKNEMEAVAYHEGSPGHHMQISIQQELQSVPTFRTQLFYGSYVEGWALYAETLAKEMGAYQNPFSDFGRLVTEMWRAIRLVVDTGIHAKGWTEQQAIEYFKQNSPISEGQIISEVQRYFVMPGQATSYKIGMLKIIELRQRAKDALGDKFDIRAFHDTVLGGGQLPLQVLERKVDNWIASQQSM